VGFSYCWDYRDCRDTCSVREQEVLFCWRDRQNQSVEVSQNCEECGYRQKWLSGDFRVRNFLERFERRSSPRTMKRVLAVDSDPHILFALEDLVSYLGHQCVTAADGEEGMLLAEETTPDLLVTDLLLPKLDGFQLCLRLQDNPKTRHIPFIIVTTRNLRKDAEMVRGLGAAAYLVKPFRSSELADHIDRALSVVHPAV